MTAAAAMAIAIWPSAQPASAVQFGFGGITGGITVYPDFTACATLDFASGTFTGVFAAVGEMQGPGTRVGTVRAVEPVVGFRTWSHCIYGAYDGATVGEGKFVLQASGGTADYSEVLQCVINRGVLTCH